MKHENKTALTRVECLVRIEDESPEQTKRLELLRARLVEFAREQKDLDPEFSKVLHDNLWDLYSR
jgi:hypothetical protein